MNTHKDKGVKKIDKIIQIVVYGGLMYGLSENGNIYFRNKSTISSKWHLDYESPELILT